jgi:hypothetical protein
VSQVDKDLRDLLEAAVGEPPLRVTVEAVRRRVVRRRAAEAVGAAAALLLVAAAGIAASVVLDLPSGNPAAVARAGVPPYYIQQTFGTRYLVVRSTATGAVTAAVRCPGRRAHVSAGPVAATGHQGFLLACQQVRRTSQQRTAAESRIYRFRLTSAGRVARYSLVPGGVLTGIAIAALAAAPDGSEVALTLARGSAAPGAAKIVVIDTRTGARAVWRGTVPGTTGLGILDLSFAHGGRELAFLVRPRCAGAPDPASCRAAGEEIWAVSPAARGGLLASSRLLLRQAQLMPPSASFIDGAVITPDGGTLTVVLIQDLQQQSAISVIQVSAVTGRHRRVLYQVRTGNGFLFGFFSADPSGRYFLLNAGPSGGSVNGWIDDGRLIQLQPADGTNILAEVW